MCKLYHVPNLMRLNIIPACRKAVPKVQSHDKKVLVPRNYNNKLNSSFFCKTLSFYYCNMRREVGERFEFYVAARVHVTVLSVSREYAPFSCHDQLSTMMEVMLSWPELLEARLTLASVNFQRNVSVSIFLNHWLTQNMLPATGPVRKQYLCLHGLIKPDRD